MAIGYEIAFNYFGYDYYSNCRYLDYEDCLLASAQNGYVHSMCELGEAYMEHHMVDRNAKAAVYWIQKVVDAGFPKLYMYWGACTGMETVFAKTRKKQQMVKAIDNMPKALLFHGHP